MFSGITYIVGGIMVHSVSVRVCTMVGEWFFMGI